MPVEERKNELSEHSKIVTLLICILPLIRYYIPGLAPIMFSDIAQLFLMFLGIAKRTNRKCPSHIPCKRSLLIYGLYAVIATVFSAIYMPVFDYSTNITTVTRLWIYILIICFTLDTFFDKEYGFNITLIIALVNCCLTTIQLILFTLVGMRTSFLIPFLNAEAGYSNHGIYNQREYRPTGLFYEPAQSVYYCLPLLLILLFSLFQEDTVIKLSRQKKITLAVVLTIGLMCTGSGAGAVIVIVVWVIFLFYYLIKSRNIKGILLLCLFLIAAPIISRLSFFSTALNRGTNVNSGSGSTRIIRGFLTWIQFPMRYKVFGIGYANYEMYVKFGKFYTEYDYIQDVGYTNAATHILSGLGIVGMLILIFFFFRTYRCSRNDLPAKLMVIYLFFSLFYSTIFLGIYFLIFMANILARTRTEIASDAENEIETETDTGTGTEPETEETAAPETPEEQEPVRKREIIKEIKSKIKFEIEFDRNKNKEPENQTKSKNNRKNKKNRKRNKKKKRKKNKNR